MADMPETPLAAAAEIVDDAVWVANVGDSVEADGVNLNTLRTHEALAANTEPLLWGLREVLDAIREQHIVTSSGRTRAITGSAGIALFDGNEEATGETVLTFMPSVTGVAQAGMGFGAFSTSTRHMRQLAAIESFLW